VAAGRGREGEHPTEPGWYPDPWSATGDGERYFDGKRWGTSEKPLGRHTVATLEARPPKPDRLRRVVLPITILVVLVAAVWGVTQLPGRQSGNEESAFSPGVKGGPPPSDEIAKQPLGTPAPVPDGTGQFEVSQHQPGDAKVPVAFDPCRPIHYAMSVTGAPPDGPEMIQSAIQRVSTATGLKFVYDGPSGETPIKDRKPFQPEAYGDTWAPVLIAWADETSFPELAGYVAGVSSPQAVFAPSGRIVYVTGQIVLDGQQLSVAEVPDRAQVEAILLHELGHLVGLDHTSDRSQLMYSETQPGVLTFGDGDRRGLALLGRQACFPNV